MRVRIKYIKDFFALGFGVERWGVMEDEDYKIRLYKKLPKSDWRAKIFLGPVLILINSH